MKTSRNLRYVLAAILCLTLFAAATALAEEDQGFVFRQTITWESSMEDVLASEADAETDLSAPEFTILHTRMESNPPGERVYYFAKDEDCWQDPDAAPEFDGDRLVMIASLYDNGKDYKDYVDLSITLSFVFKNAYMHCRDPKEVIGLQTEAPSSVNLLHCNEAASPAHPLGTDNMGRDVFSLLVAETDGPDDPVAQGRSKWAVEWEGWDLGDGTAVMLIWAAPQEDTGSGRMALFYVCPDGVKTDAGSGE